MADVRHVGNDYGLYLAAGPTEPALPGTTANYTALGLEVGHQLSLNAEEIPAVDKDSGGFVIAFAGQQSYQLSVNGNLSKEGNAAQQILEDAGLATTQDGKSVFWLSTPTGAANQQRRGEGRVLSFEITENVNEVATFTATLSGVGAYVREAAST